MKVAQYSAYGGPEVINIAEVDTPKPVAGQVLVQVKSAAINPFDTKLRRGMFKDIPLNFPVTVGADFSGIIIETGSDVLEFKTGDEVYGSASTLGGGSGAAAECTVANTKSIALKPNNVSFEEAAALVLVGVSATQALDQLNLSPGKKILIHGGAGGIGSIAIQYAKSLGAEIATTAQASDKDFVSQLGAGQAVDYENERFEDVLSDFDAVFDTIGGDTYQRSFKVLKQDGIIISMVARPEEMPAGSSVAALYQNTQVTTESLDKLRGLVEAGTIMPQVDRTFSLSETPIAFQHLEIGHPRGKVVIRM